MRICSLLPGATEVVAALGLADQLVGISHECDYPPEIQNKPIVVRPAVDAANATSAEIDHAVRAALADGRTLYDLNEDLFKRVQPDLIITQDLCHVCAMTPDRLERTISALPVAPRVVSLNATTIDDVLTDIERIGTATGRPEEARQLVAKLRARLEAIHAQVAEAPRPKVACLEWLDPLFAAGHWVPEMVAYAGGENVLGSAGEPSMRITWQQLLDASPDVLICMPCGFTAERTVREAERLADHPHWKQLPAVRHGQTYAVDAVSYFSRPGPRLIEGVAILAAAFHPSLFGRSMPEGLRRLA